MVTTRPKEPSQASGRRAGNHRPSLNALKPQDQLHDTGADVRRGPVASREERRTSDAETLAVLTRWEQAGGVWRVTRWSGDVATVALMRCDAGEVVDEVSASGPGWVQYLAGRPSSEA